MVNVIEAYNGARKSLGEMFGLDDLWHNVIDLSGEIWTDFDQAHDEIGYGGDVEDGELAYEYSLEIYGTSRWVSKCGGYTLFVGDNGCGDRDMYLFDNSNKVD